MSFRVNGISLSLSVYVYVCLCLFPLQLRPHLTLYSFVIVRINDMLIKLLASVLPTSHPQNNISNVRTNTLAASHVVCI
jgi:hypothetical protein